MTVSMNIARYNTTKTRAAGSIGRFGRRIADALAVAGTATLEGLAISGDQYGLMSTYVGDEHPFAQPAKAAATRDDDKRNTPSARRK